MSRKPLQKSKAMIAAGALMIPAGLVRILFGVYMLYLYGAAHVMGTVPSSQLLAACATLGVHLACGFCEIAVGFFGVTRWDEPLLTHKSVRLGAATLALGLLGNGLQYYIGFGVSYVAWITGAIVPSLFLLAAIRFRVRGMPI